MSDTAKKLLEQALKLSSEERALLGAELLESVHDDLEDDKTAWREEIRRRIEEIDRGEVDLLDGDEVLHELLRKYPRR